MAPGSRREDVRPEDDVGGFPLDAFFVPEDAHRVPMGLESRRAPSPRGRVARSRADRSEHRPDAVANRLEELASGLRSGGSAAAALWAADPDPLRRALGEALRRFLPADR